MDELATGVGALLILIPVVVVVEEEDDEDKVVVVEVELAFVSGASVVVAALVGVVVGEPKAKENEYSVPSELGVSTTTRGGEREKTSDS